MTARAPAGAVRPRARKRFGQHFLVDPGIIAAIVRRFAPQPDERIVEIGPGTGALTAPLLDAGARLTVIEFDRDMVSHLEQRFGSHPRFRLVPGDVLSVDPAVLQGGGGFRVIGNLPYNISSPILFRLLDWKPRVEDLYFMLQKEVVERITAPPGSRVYGRPSVALQRVYHVSTDLDIPPQAFRPPPRVNSAMLRLRARDEPLGGAVDDTLFDAVTAAAFGQRRKTLRNALKPLLAAEHLESAGIDPSRRAETLTVEDFVRITRQLASTRREPRHPN